MKKSSDTPQAPVIARDPMLFGMLRGVASWGYRHLSHAEVDPRLAELVRLKRERPQSVFLYAALHKSLWETTGIPVALHRAGLPTPYAVMGDNLVHGRLFINIVNRVGGIVVRRPGSPAAAVSVVRRYLSLLDAHLAAGLDVLVFPEGTRTSIPKKGRYGDFFHATFEAVLANERRRQTEPGRCECFIIPCNVDYSYVREAEGLVRSADGRPQTLHVWDSLKMLAHIHDLYIGFGRPIAVAGRSGLDRQELAEAVRHACLELVRVLPVNIVAAAWCDGDPAGRSDRGRLLDNIRAAVDRLRPYHDRFKGLTPETPAETILDQAVRINPHFRFTGSDREPFFRLYRNYIGHYLGS